MSPDGPSFILRLLADIPHVMVSIKGQDGRYLAVNAAFIQQWMRGVHRQAVGSQAVDLFPADLAALYDAQDQTIWRTGQPQRNYLEIITDSGGQPSWYLTTKMLDGYQGQAVIVAVSVAANLPRRGTQTGDGLRAAVSFVRAEYAGSLRVGDVAAVAGMSNDQLERAMRSVLAVSPKQLIIRVRVEQAGTLLVTTTRAISDIAASCGFYDQAQMTRQFRNVVGVTPGHYRRS